MGWSPQYFAVQEEGLIDNIVTIVRRDFKEALDLFYPIEAALTDSDPRYLRDFLEIALGQIQSMTFPSLAIGPRRNASTESDGADRLIEAIEFEAWLGVTDDSDENVTRRIMRYAGTFDAVLRTAARKTKRDFFVNMSTRVFGLRVELEHVYGPIGQRNSEHFRSVTVLGTIYLNEA